MSPLRAAHTVAAGGARCFRVDFHDIATRAAYFWRLVV